MASSKLPKKPKAVKARKSRKTAKKAGREPSRTRSVKKAVKKPVKKTVDPLIALRAEQKKSRSDSAKKGWITRYQREINRLQEAGPSVPKPSEEEASDWLSETLAQAKKRLKAEKRKLGRGRFAHNPEKGFVPLVVPSDWGREGPKKLTRSDSARRGWITRRHRKFQSEGVSYLGSRDWAEMSTPRANALDKLTWDIFGPYHHIYGPQRHAFVKSGLEMKDRRFVLFMNMAREMGYTVRQARTALFSPKARAATA